MVHEGLEAFPREGLHRSGIAVEHVKDDSPNRSKVLGGVACGGLIRNAEPSEICPEFEAA